MNQSSQPSEIKNFGNDPIASTYCRNDFRLVLQNEGFSKFISLLENGPEKFWFGVAVFVFSIIIFIIAMPIYVFTIAPMIEYPMNFFTGLFIFGLTVGGLIGGYMLFEKYSTLKMVKSGKTHDGMCFDNIYPAPDTGDYYEPEKWSRLQHS